MFMTVCELAFIPNKSLRACSLDATWIRVFSDNRLRTSISAATPDGQTRTPRGKDIARGLPVGTKPNSARGADLAERVRSILSEQTPHPL